MTFKEKINLKDNEKKYLKTLKKDLKILYKKEKLNAKIEKNNIHKMEDLSSDDKLKECKKIDDNLKNIKLDNKFQIKEQKNKVLQAEPTKIGYYIKKHKIIFSILLLFILLSTIVGKMFYENSKPNYQNDFFSFKYNQEKLFIDDYTSIANMWVVSTGGGIYEPSIILIGYTHYGADLTVDQPLKNLQDEFGGERTDEVIELTENFASDDYILTLDNLSYKILSKSYKEDSEILTVMYINAGNLTEEEQAYLYQVYKTIKLN